MSDNTQNFNEILKSLTELSNTFNLSIFIPSLKNYFEFKELNTKQQKQLLETITDNSIYKTKFTETFLNIIKENILSKNIDIDTLSIYDKFFIGLFLRAKISTNLNFIFNENPIYSENVDLSPIIQKSVSYNHPEQETIESIKDNTKISVEVSIPSIILESKYESELSKNYQKIDDVKNPNDMGNLISDAFVGEVSKYINKISFDDKSIELKDFTVNQRIRLTELLTADLTQKVLQKIAEWKTELDSILTINSKDNNYKKTLSLDNLLFLM